MTPGQTCDTCKAFSPLDNQCRRKSPTAVVIPAQGGLQIIPAYPPTKKDGWCCEWEAQSTNTRTHRNVELLRSIEEHVSHT